MSLFSSSYKTGALLSIILIVTVWGSASAVTKLAVENIPPYVFAFLRNAVASACLLPYYFIRKKSITPSLPLPWKKVVWMGLTGITFFYLLFNLSLYYTTASAGALIQGFIPVAIILLSILFLKEKLKKIQIAGILLSVIGVVLIGFVGAFAGARNAILGNTLMIFAVLCWGFYTVISKSLQQYDTVQLTAISTSIGTIGLLPAVAFQLWQQPQWPTISMNGWLSILYLGIFSSAICYILYNKVLKVLSGVQVGNFMNFDPVVGALIAIIFLGEKVTVWQVIGGVLVLIGVALTSRRA